MLCAACQLRPIPRGNRRYCESCSPHASVTWKARHRRQWAADWRAKGRRGEPPWLDGWPSLEARRAYYRTYMAEWRRQRRDRRESATASEVL
jgi:hypothetical protein